MRILRIVLSAWAAILLLMKRVKRKKLGPDGPEIPPILFGSSALGNLYQVLPFSEKLAIARAWFNSIEPPIVIDSAGKYGAGLALESIGQSLSRLGVRPDDVLLSNKLGWRRVPLKGAEPTFEPGVWKELKYDAVQDFSGRGIVECWEQGNDLLGAYSARIVSCHDPDEYLAAASGPADRERRLEDILESYEALFELKARGYVDAVGVGAKEWRVIQELATHLRLDWAMFACSFTVHTHDLELRAFMLELKSAGTSLINSAVFHSGFLTGGDYFDYRRPDPLQEANLFEWRRRFQKICAEYSVEPAQACVEFGLRPEPITAIALNTARASRVEGNVALLSARAPEAFWSRLKEEGLIDITPGENWT
jgi:D-threo-aldose 1-dehydrogenase